MVADADQNTSILVLDDDANITRLTRSVLSMSGYQVTESNAPPEALKIVQSQAFDLILVDIMMPEMDGVEFIRQSRKTTTNAATRYAILSAKKLNQEDRREIYDLGAEIMAKPFMPNQLVDMITELLQKEPRKVVTSSPQEQSTVIDDDLEKQVQNVVSPNGTLSLKETHDRFEKLIDMIIQENIESRLQIVIEKISKSQLMGTIEMYLKRMRVSFKSQTQELFQKGIDNYRKDQAKTITLFAKKIKDGDLTTKKYYTRLLLYTVVEVLIRSQGSDEK